MLKTHLLAATALLALTAPLAHASGNLYVFGDSLSDNGNLYKLIGSPPAPYYDGRFSNGPVWAEYLPSLTGLAFTPGQDYAYGGAFTGDLTVNGTDYGTNYVSAGLPGITTEIASFTAAGGHFSSGDVVTLWGGANNYFLYASLVEAAPSSAATLIPAAVNTTITQLTADTSALISLGAQTLIVPNLPDLGATPDYNNSALGALGTALGDAFSNAHNQALPGEMATLHATTGANIIVLNTEQLLNTVIGNPAAYGFSNVTDACINVSSCVAGTTAQQNTYVFWDGVHPTTHAQDIIAQYAARSLNSFESLSVPARLGTTDAQNFQSLLGNRMETLRAAGTGFTYNIQSNSYAPPVDASTDPAQKLSLYITGSGSFDARNNTATTLGYNGDSTAVALGADYAITPTLRIGLAAGLTNGHANINEGGHVDDNAANIGLYALATQGPLYEELSAAYGDNWYNIRHPGVLGGIQGKPSGASYSVSAIAGYVFPITPNLSLTPSAGLDYTNVSLQSYTESGDPLLTQSVAGQGYQQLLGQAALEAATSTLFGTTRVATYATVGMQARLSGDNSQFSSTFTDEPLVPLTTTYPAEPVAWALLSAGASASLTNHLSASAAIQATAFKSNGNDLTISGAVNWTF